MNDWAVAEAVPYRLEFPLFRKCHVIVDSRRLFTEILWWLLPSFVQLVNFQWSFNFRISERLLYDDLSHPVQLLERPIR